MVSTQVSHFCWQLSRSHTEASTREKKSKAVPRAPLGTDVNSHHIIQTIFVRPIVGLPSCLADKQLIPTGGIIWEVEGRGSGSKG